MSQSGCRKEAVSQCALSTWRRHPLRTVAALLGTILWAMSVGAPLEKPPDTQRSFIGTPFGLGERLVFHVDWNPPWYLFFLPSMEAGEAELSVSGETQYEGKKALRIIFKARSSGTLVRLAGVAVDDHFEFITDPETFCTFAVKKRVHEGKRKRTIEVVYLPEQKRLHIREVDIAVVPNKVKKDEYKSDIPECVKDLFSALYSMRQRDLQLGTRHSSIVGDNDRIKEIEARIEKSETVETPSGRYMTWRVNTVALVGGLFKEGGEFKMWITADERKMPVQFVANVNLGRVTGKLRYFEQPALGSARRSQP